MALKSVIDWLVTPPSRSAPRAPVAAQPGSRAINVLVCDFDGPDGRQLALRLVEAFSGKPRVSVQHQTRKLKLSGKDGVVEQLLGAAETGRKWLANTNCDVLLWGETTEADTNMTVRFLCATADADKQAGSFGLGDTLELSVAYDAGLEKLIFAATVAAVAPRKKASDRDILAKVLLEASDSLQAYIETPPNDLAMKQFTSVMTCIGTIFAALWRVGDDGKYLDLAIKSYRSALSRGHDAEDPLAYALTQNHMALALQALSKRDKNPAPLKMAAECYRKVASVLGPNTHANDWALAHIHLGDVLVNLSETMDREKFLNGASSAYQSALKIFTRQTTPGPWAELMNQLGVTLMAISETKDSPRTLDQAASCFRQSLEVRRRSVAPLLWAQAANNLGAVTFSIYKHTNNAVLLNEAASCFEGAAEVYAEHGRNNTARVARNNLGRIRQLQTERL